MTTIIGKLVVNAEGLLCIQMNEMKDNPALGEIPISEILEEFVGKKVKIDVMPFGKLESHKEGK